MIRAVSKRDAKSVRCRVEAVLKVDKDIGGPQPVLQLFARDDLAGPLNQRQQHLQRLSLQPDLDAVLPQLARARLELEDPEPQDRAGTTRPVAGYRGHSQPSTRPRGYLNIALRTHCSQPHVVPPESWRCAIREVEPARSSSWQLSTFGRTRVLCSPSVSSVVELFRQA